MILDTLRTLLTGKRVSDTTVEAMMLTQEIARRVERGEKIPPHFFREASRMLDRDRAIGDMFGRPR